MQTTPAVNPLRALIMQPQNNTTFWIGHLQADPTDHFGGQTFTCPSEGMLDNIQLYASVIPTPGDIQLSLHEFDAVTKTWGRPIAETSLQVHKSDDRSWLRFSLPSIHLDKAITYGFRLHTSNAMIGLGEAASDNRHPFIFGQVWKADSQNQHGYYSSYFSLAFKVEMRA